VRPFVLVVSKRARLLVGRAHRTTILKNVNSGEVPEFMKIPNPSYSPLFPCIPHILGSNIGSNDFRCKTVPGLEYNGLLKQSGNGFVSYFCICPKLSSLRAPRTLYHSVQGTAGGAKRHARHCEEGRRPDEAISILSFPRKRESKKRYYQ